MNWGKSIVLVFIVFAGFIGTLVYKMTRQHVDLVRDDYYQTEMTYQQQIDRVTNASRQSPVAMKYVASQHKLTIALPKMLRTGDVRFYRPSDRKLDFTVPIAAQHTDQQQLSTAELARGFWRVQLTWTDGQRDYYTEQDLFL
jgi:hypothetical protein